MAACEDKKMIEGKGFPELNAATSSLAILLTVSESSTHRHVCLLKIRDRNFQDGS
jgi:hypothetical protein